MYFIAVLCLIGVVAGAPQGYDYNTAGASYGYSHQQPAPIVTPAPIVSKYFYIHEAPEDAVEAVDYSREVAPAHKNYRVVFIKSPHDNLAHAVQRLAAARDEEQTAIYVLHKKTDAADLKAVLDATPQHVSKPSVHFIKYKTAEEAALAQQQIQAQYDALGGTSQVSNEGVAPLTSVIGQAPVQPSTAYVPAPVQPSTAYVPAPVQPSTAYVPAPVQPNTAYLPAAY